MTSPGMPLIVSLLTVGGCALALLATGSAAHSEELYVRPGVAPGGSGTAIDDPLPTIQEAVDRAAEGISYLFLHPGTYEEDIEINRGRFWFRPVERTGGVIISGSLTIRAPNCIVRGLDFRSDGTAITLADGAAGTQIMQTRILAFGEGSAAIDLTGSDLSGVLLSDNIIDMRASEAGALTGIRVRVAPGVRGLRLEHNQIAGCEIAVQVVADEGVVDERSFLTGNRISDNAVGLLLAAPGIVAARNEFLNHADAAVRLSEGSVVLDANRFEGDAVAIHCMTGEATVTNNVIANPRGQALRAEGGISTLLHNTLHAGADIGAPLLEVTAGATMALRQNILSGSRTLLSSEGAVSASGNLYSHETAVDDDGAIIADPGFISADAGDFRLRPDSAAAHRAAVPATNRDAAGVGRPWGERASIGAYEVAGEREGRTIHVAAGLEGGDGSAEAPFGSIAQALEHALPGDTILLRPGEYAEGRVTITRSGAPEMPITLRSEVPHQARMRDVELYLDQCSHVRIEGFDFTGTEPRQFIHAGALVRHCEFVNNVFTRTEGHGRAILISGPASRHNLIEGNRIAMNSGAQCRGSGCCEGLQISCQRQNRHQIIRDNHFTGCYYGIQTGAGSYPTAPPGYNLIENNIFRENRADGVHTKSTDDLIRNNVFFRNGGSGVTTREGARNVIIGNWMIENGGGLRLHSPSHFVINNVIAHNRGVAIQAYAARLPHYEAPPELWIAHNTIAGNVRGQIVLGALSGAHILRNIIVGADPSQQAVDRDSMGGGTARQVDANLYWNVLTPMLREYEGGLHDSYRDPLFLDPGSFDYRIADDSPARSMPQINDALSAVLSAAPGGIELPDHIGSNLGTPWGGVQEQ